MREKEPTTRVIYVRHGKTDFPTDRIYCDDREDPPLNDDGVAQARAAAGLLAAQTVDAICASPSARARMTAEAIAAAAGVPVIDDVGLRERRFGLWDGLTFAEIAERHAEAYQAWRQDPVRYTPAGGETIEDLLQRVTGVVQGLVGEYGGKTIVVVSHVGPIRVALSAALKIPVEWYRQLRIDYGSLTGVDYGASQNNLVYANLTKSLFF